MSTWSDYVQQWLQGQQTGTPQAGGVNRSGLATPPPIPIPSNQNPNAGGYMGQAFNLSGVPTQSQPAAPVTPSAAPTQQNGLSPEYQGWINALLGGGGFGQLNTMGMPPELMSYLRSLGGR